MAATPNLTVSRIRVLPEGVANQIAAGEVVERPAAVVKELVENALDAGASAIEVEFRGGGRSLIRVEDDGCGMGRDDALLAFERHATSKIAEFGDLDRLSTYGFRGEALPSIASVSRCTLRTRSRDSIAGTEVVIDAGRLLHVRECGRPPGTRIEIERLFHSVPARRKFLKSDETESAHISQCVRLYALSRPQTAWALLEDGRESFRSPRCATLLERASEILGGQVADLLEPIDVEGPGMRLRGLIGRPGPGRASRHELLTFVNGRPVDSRTLAGALAEAYRDSIPKGRYPLAVVFFECAPSAVDVNVHPAKREVKFRNDAAVREFVLAAAVERLRALSKPAIAPPAPGPSAAGAEWPAPPAAERTTPLQEPEPPSAAERVKSAVLPLPWRCLGQAHGDYAIFEAPGGLVVLDRRAAQERIWFERLRGQFLRKAVAAQQLLLPIPIELDPVGAALLRENVQFMRANGFDIADFGPHFFRIEAVPSWMEPDGAEPFIREILAAWREGRIGPGDTFRAAEEVARLAASRAVRLASSPSAEELEELAAELFATRSPHTSPRGRATFVEVGHGELDRRFQKS